MDWKKIRESSSKVGYRYILSRIFLLPDGKEHEFTILNIGSVAAIVAITPENKVIMTRQFRPGPEKTLLEVPGGLIEKGESPFQGAARELLEETGYQGEIFEVGMSFQSAYTTGIRHIFLVKNAKKVAEPHLDPTEHIETVLISMDEFKSLLRSGQLTDMGAGYRVLDYLNASDHDGA